MNSTMFRDVLIGAVAVAMAVTASAAGSDYSFGSYGTGNTFDDFIRDRLSIGVRVSTFSLLDADRPRDWSRQKTFLGYINELKEENTVNVVPTISWWASQYCAFEFTWDGVEASTWNLNNHATDGNIKMSGPIFSLRGQYPLFENRVIPYIGAGLAFWSADFERSANWARRSDGMQRLMLCDDDVGLALSAGVGLRPHPRCEIDLMVRYLDVSSDAEFWYARHGVKKSLERTGEFTLEHIAYGAALSYVF